MQLRNQLIATERQLSKLGDGDALPFFEQIRQERFPYLKGYNGRDLNRFELVYGGLSSLERRYFNAFSGFIAREHQLAKTGIQGSEFVNGLASIWLDSIEEKEEVFQLLQALRIHENKANEADAIIIFEKTAATNPLANFRAGDIAILYPRRSAAREANSPYFTSQIFKVTVLDIAESTVKVRLRMRQFNLDIFKDHEEWNIEHDQMDMSFSSMYQGLFRWAECPPDKRALLLTARPPRQPEEVDTTDPAGSGAGWQPAGEPTEEQRQILGRMLAAPEYFLLWGPPGTGKTSQMLRNFAGWIFHRTDENLLLLAYTNRAVDEICEALESLGDEVRESYMRIGSRFSTGEAFQGRLLNAKAAQVKTRKELLALLGRHRIFVSTLASLSNNLDLLRLKKFRRVVIDEASQILEPALVGLLPQFEQFILVGDHKQLPAVVVQDEAASAVKEEDLKALGLDNLRNSLFERLYRRCISQQWDWACAHLSYQGRMHEDIMRFPGSYFYEGKLQVLPFASGQSDSWPPAALASRLGQLLRHEWQRPVLEHRLAFIPTEVDQRSRSRKTNEDEALRVASLVQLFQDIYRPEAAGAGRPRSIGIITPYRAQIARLRETLQQQGIDTRGITIDTVERYQGGARDIILISLCTNTAEQVKTLVSLSEEGVDRKLNVALTRAREHVVVLGNEELLATQPVYRRFVEFCRGDAEPAMLPPL
jgi:DNA replication ATP-dependent helicase Dna2